MLKSIAVSIHWRFLKTLIAEINIPEGVEGCIYKLWYAGKYVVIRCKTLRRSKQNLEIDIKYFFKNQHKNRPEERREGNLYHDFYCHILENPDQNFTVEILLPSNNPLELLKAEYMELLKAKYDPRCLNNNFEPYIPKFTQVNGKKSWINRGYYLNYMNWKKKFSNPNMIE